MARAVRKYAFINAKLRARISNLISEEILQRMKSAHTLEEALGLLRDTQYNVLDKIYRSTGDLKFGELELLKKEIGLYTEIEKYVTSVELELVKALALNYEIENLKNALRLYFERSIMHRNIENKIYYIFRDKIQYDIKVDRIINADNLEDISAALNGTPYARVIEQNRDEIVKGGSLFPLEIALDQFFYKNLISHAENLTSLDKKETLRLVGVEIDLQNINWVIRFRTFYDLPLERVLALIIPQVFNIDERSIREAYSSQNVSQILDGVIKAKYPGLSAMLASRAPAISGTPGISSRLLLIEQILEQIMTREIRRILAGYPFTIGIILSYFILRKNELNKVRAILNAKQYNISGDILS
jgi:V/A-type H+-transporting ATPase subunit C